VEAELEEAEAELEEAEAPVAPPPPGAPVAPPPPVEGLPIVNRSIDEYLDLVRDETEAPEWWSP
jgi:hypothetical protein